MFDSLLNTLDQILLPSPVSRVAVVSDDTKSIAEVTHINGRLVLLKEIRTLKTSNLIHCFVLENKFGVSQAISSYEELTDFATRFFSSTFCYGFTPLPHINVKMMTKGFVNSAGQWQSTLCARKIEKPEWHICCQCNRLRESLDKKGYRYIFTNTEWMLEYNIM